MNDLFSVVEIRDRLHFPDRTLRLGFCSFSSSSIKPLVLDMLKIDELAEFVTIFVPEALILGMFLTLFRNVIYRIYKGRLLWPD